MKFEFPAPLHIPVDALLYTAPPDGCVARPYIHKFAEQISLLDFVPYTTANDVTMSEAVALAVQDYLQSPGRKALYIPSRKFCFESNVNAGCITAVDPPDGLTIHGDGPSSLLYVLSGTAAPGETGLGGINIMAASDVTIRGLAIDCNRQGNPGAPGAHGIRYGSGLMHNIRLLDLHIKNTQSYGIGMALPTPPAGESFRRVKFDNIYLESIGNDGIDFKNWSFANEDIVINNVNVNGFNINGEGEVAGIDIRGAAMLSNIWVSGATAEQHNLTGIRFRHGDVAGSGGGEGRRSGVSNFWVRLVDNRATQPEPSMRNKGLAIEAPDCRAVNGYVESCAVGVEAHDRSRITNVHAVACGVGFSTLSASASFVNCSARDSVASDVETASGVAYAACRFLSTANPNPDAAADIIAATQGSAGTAGGYTGLIRNAGGEIEYHINGLVYFTFDISGRLRSSYGMNTLPQPGPSDGFITNAKIQIGTGSSQSGIAFRGSADSERMALAFETPGGAVMTAHHSSTGLIFRDDDGNVLFSIGHGNKLGFWSAPVSKPTGVAVSAAGIHAALVTLGLIAA